MGGGALSEACDAGKNLVRGSGPDEPFGTFVMNVELLANGHLEFFQASKNAAANALVGNFGKPAFHQCVVTSIRLWFPTSINTAASSIPDRGT